MTPHPMPDLEFEIPLWNSGLFRVVGLDEAGRGAWAGPVSAGAVMLPPDPEILHRLERVRDSKLMTARQRAAQAERIQCEAAAWGVGMAGQDEIDRLGIIRATRLAMQRALEAAGFQPDHLLVDALRLPDLHCPQTPIIKGDQRCLSIAAASVLAKTARDRWMTAQDEYYPGYGFARHKGYGTAQHQQALKDLGLCRLHRCSYAPLRALLPTPLEVESAAARPEDDR